MGKGPDPVDDSRELLQLMRAAVPVMRELGVAQATIGGMTLVLGPPPPSAEILKSVREDANYDRRLHYSQLLGRAVSNKELENLP